MTSLQSQYLLCPPLTCNTAGIRLGIDSINRWIRSCGILPILAPEPAAVLVEIAALVDDWCTRRSKPRGCSGTQKVGARKIARCHFKVPVLKVRGQFRSQLTFLQGANFFEPKQWMIACTTTSFMFSFMYKWSGFVCTNVNVCIVLLFFISISSSKTKRFIKFITIYCILWIIRDSARILRPLVTFAEQIFNVRA